MDKNFMKLGLLSFLLFIVGPAMSYGNSYEENKLKGLDIVLPADTLSAELSNYLFLRLNMEVDPPQMDTISYLYNKYIGELEYLNDESVPMRYIAFNPYTYRLVTPLAYYNSPIKQYSLPDYEMKSFVQEPEWMENPLNFDDSKWTRMGRANKLVDKVLLNIYREDYKLLVTTENRIKGREILVTTASSAGKDKDEVKRTIDPLFKADSDLSDDLSLVEKYISRPNWWLTGGQGSLQVTQNYISTNWHKGGESNNSLLANIKLFADYNDREKIQFENILEAKFGFNTLSSDTVRSYRINTDLFRLSSKLGVKAASNWYYTLAGEFNTQFAPNYQKNSEKMVSAFLAPANLILGLGMDYKLKKRKINLSVMLSPATYNLRYVRNSRVDETKFGLKEGKKILHDVGSKLESRMEWKMFPFMVWSSRLWYFTNYEKVEADWENTFNFILNRYLSTQIFIHARYDDGVSRLPGKNYFQLKELLSFGINYKW